MDEILGERNGTRLSKYSRKRKKCRADF